MSKKKIAVFFEKPNFEDYPFDNEEYCKAYYEFAKVVEQKGGEFFIVRGYKNHLGNTKFKIGWDWNGSEFKKTGEFTANAIYDKGRLANTAYLRKNTKAKILNPNPIVEVCNNKFKTYQLFRKFCPRTEIALNQVQFFEALEKIKSALKVIKPLDSYGGNGVVIGDIEKLKTVQPKFPILIQEFIDTSAGIPGIDSVNSYHDFRMIIVNGKIVHSFARTPPKDGSLTASVARGGTYHEIKIGKIPSSAIQIFNNIDQKFKDYHRVYSIDLGFNQSRQPKIIELNSQPGLHSSKWSAGFINFQEKLADALLNFN